MINFYIETRFNQIYVDGANTNKKKSVFDFPNLYETRPPDDNSTLKGVDDQREESSQAIVQEELVALETEVNLRKTDDTDEKVVMETPGIC